MDLLSSLDLSKKEIETIFAIADKLKSGKIKKGLEGKVLGLFFEKPSTRTMISFEVAIMHLGGSVVYVDKRESQNSRGETFSDTGKIMSLYLDFIAARLFKQSDLIEMAKGSSVPVINALTELEHPVQALGDVYTMIEEKGKIRGLKIAFVGDIAANTANSLMVTASLLGAEIALVGPKGYAPNNKYVSFAKKHSKIVIYNDIKEGLSNADFIYTDTFISMGEESEMEKRRKMFAPYQLNSKVLKYAKNDAKVMHCLPAHRGEEITGDVLDGKQSIVMRQAKNKLLMEKAVLLYLNH